MKKKITPSVYPDFTELKNTKILSDHNRYFQNSKLLSIRKRQKK